MVAVVVALVLAVAAVMAVAAVTAVAVVVAVVVEVDVVVMGGVPFGHPLPSKMSTIILITLSDKVIVLKKGIIIIDHFMLFPPITITTPLLPFVMLPPPLPSTC